MARVRKKTGCSICLHYRWEDWDGWWMCFRISSKGKGQKVSLRDFQLETKECKVFKFKLWHERERVPSRREITPTIGVLLTCLPKLSFTFLDKLEILPIQPVEGHILTLNLMLWDLEKDINNADERSFPHSQKLMEDMFGWSFFI